MLAPVDSFDKLNGETMSNVTAGHLPTGAKHDARTLGAELWYRAILLRRAPASR
jgi:hypothetical protein